MVLHGRWIASLFQASVYISSGLEICSILVDDEQLVESREKLVDVMILRPAEGSEAYKLLL